MPAPEIPDGYALVSISTLAALMASRGRQPEPAPYAATWEGLAAATGMLTGRLGGCQMPRADLAAAAPDEAIIGALVTVAASLLKVHHGDRAPDALQVLGLLAATETGTDGRDL